MSEYKLKTGKIEKAVVGAYKKIEAKFVEAFLNEDGSMKTGGMAEKATGTYQKIEDAAVGAYKKVENAFVKAFLEEVDEDESEQSSGEITDSDNESLTDKNKDVE